MAVPQPRDDTMTALDLNFLRKTTAKEPPEGRSARVLARPDDRSAAGKAYGNFHGRSASIASLVDAARPRHSRPDIEPDVPDGRKS